MAVNSVPYTSLNPLALNSNGNNDPQLSIGVSAPPGKTMTPAEILRAAVSSALGTKDKAQIEEFIKQNNLTPPKEIPAKRENGQIIYEYPVDGKFYTAADEFKNRMPPETPVINQPKYDRNTANVRNGIDRSTANRQNLDGKLASVKTSGANRNQTAGQTVFDGELQIPKQVTESQARAIRQYNADIWQRTREGLDGKTMRIPLSLADLTEIKNNIKDGDARLEVMTKGLQKLGYSDEAIKNVLAQENLSTDGTSGIHILSGETSDAKADVNRWLDGTIAEWKDRGSINNINNNRNVTWSNLGLDAGLRKKVFIEDLRLKGGDGSVTLYNQKLELQNKINQISADYTKKLDKAQNLLETSILVNNRDDQIKSAIDESYAKLNLDLRGNQTNGQQTANQTADTIEKVIRIGLETNPTTMFLPESMKNRIVNAGIGLTNGVTYLASAVKGANDFVADQAIDAINYGLKQIPNERIQKFAAEFEKSNTELRENRADWWRSITDLKTANLSRLDAALDNKIQIGLPLNALDIPSFERSVGKILPQAAIQGGIAVATAGASIGAQIALTAAVNGGMTFGATYATTNDGWKAGKEAAITAAQTAVIPITSKIPGMGGEAINLTSTYIFGKMSGQNDVEILDQILTQGLLSAANKFGGKFGELTKSQKETVRQQAWQTYKTIAGEVNKAVDTQYQAAKSKFNLQTAEADYKLAKIELSKTATAVVSPILGVGAGAGGISPVRLSKALVDVGKYHLLNGANNFKEFSARVIGDVGEAARGKLKSLYEQTVGTKEAAADKTFQAAKAKNWNDVETNWLNKDVKDGVPEGYYQRGDEIVRKTDNSENYVKLKVEDGKIALADAKTNNRISDSYAMTKNFDADLEARWTQKLRQRGVPEAEVKTQATKITDEIKGLINRHHMIADNVVQNTDLGKRALKAGYKPKLDEVNNLIGMPNTEAAKQRLIQFGEITPNTPQHRGPHPLFDKKVTDILNKAQKKLESDFGKPIDQIPDKIILEKMKEVEKQVREMIKKGDVDTKNDKLSFYESPQRRLEIRV